LLKIGLEAAGDAVLVLKPPCMLLLEEHNVAGRQKVVAELGYFGKTPVETSQSLVDGLQSVHNI